MNLAIELEGRHPSAPQLSIPAEATARTAKLLAAVLAMMPKCCGSFELVVAAPVGHQEAQPSVPLYADPFVMLLALLFIMQAWMFVKPGAEELKEPALTSMGASHLLFEHVSEGAAAGKVQECERGRLLWERKSQ